MTVTRARCVEQRIGGEAVDVEFDLLRRLGITVVEVPGLRNRAAYVEDQMVALVRAGQSHAQREGCADWLLSEVSRPSSDATAS